MNKQHFKLTKSQKKRISALFIGLISCGASAWAYDSSDDSDIYQERHISDYAQQGIRAGAFNILPKLAFNNEYRTNIYYRDKALGTADSYIAHFKPGFMAASDWNRHSLNFMLDTDLALFSNQGSRNDYNNIFTKVKGRVDVLRDSHFDGGFGYNYLTESRGSPDQISGVTPTIYDTKVIDTFYTHTLNRIVVRGGLNAVRYDYQDVSTSLGTTLQMSTRDRWLFAPEMRVGYLIQPEYEAFLRFVYVSADYDTLVRANGAGRAYNRNSTGFNALGGMAFDVTGLITGDVSLGYIQRSYEDPLLPQISGINGFLNLKWRPTALTTVRSVVARTIQETTQAGVSGIFGVSAGLSVEHELMRNVLLNVAGNYANNIYNGFAFPRTQDRNDNLYTASAGAKYLINRNFSTDLTYTFNSRDTNYQLNNYNVNQVMLNFRTQY